MLGIKIGHENEGMLDSIFLQQLQVKKIMQCCLNHMFNTLRPRQNGRHFADVFKCIFLNENAWIEIKISLMFVPNKGPINNIPALVRIMVWRWLGDKPLSELMMIKLLTHMRHLATVS